MAHLASIIPYANCYIITLFNPHKFYAFHNNWGSEKLTVRCRTTENGICDTGPGVFWIIVFPV